MFLLTNLRQIKFMIIFVDVAVEGANCTPNERLLRS